MRRFTAWLALLLALTFAGMSGAWAESRTAGSATSAATAPVILAANDAPTAAPAVAVAVEIGL